MSSSNENNTATIKNKVNTTITAGKDCGCQAIDYAICCCEYAICCRKLYDLINEQEKEIDRLKMLLKEKQVSSSSLGGFDGC